MDLMTERSPDLLERTGIHPTAIVGSGAELHPEAVSEAADLVFHALVGLVAPRVAGPKGLPLFCVHLLQQGNLQGLVGHQLFQLRVLALQAFKPSQIGPLHARIHFLPPVNRLLRHPMPPGHLPVRSYLAVPVVSRTGEVLGGMFFGHPDEDVFTERSERLVIRNQRYLEIYGLPPDAIHPGASLREVMAEPAQLLLRQLSVVATAARAVIRV